jgi:hypothetical protein
MTAPIRPHLTPAARAQRFAPALITMLLIVLLVGFSTLVVSSWPLQLGELQWRFRNMAVLLSTLPQICFLTTAVCVVAVHAGEHRMVRIMSIAALIFGAFIVVCLPFFALDFLSVRHLQPQDTVANFTREAIRLGIAATFLALGLIWLGKQGLPVSKRDPDSEETAVGHGLIVAQAE